MKKFIASLLLFSFSGLLYAREDPALWERVPDPNSYVSQAVNLSTYVNIFTGSPTTLVISSYSVLLHTINVSSSGINSVLEVYDASVSTAVIGGSVRKIQAIDTSKVGTYHYDIYCSSGLSLYGYGIRAPDVSVIYREK